MRRASALAALALSVSMLAGCGGNSTDAYCSELKKDKAYFDSFDNGDTSKIDDAFDKFHSLADKAPSEVKDDWKILDDAITTVQKSLKDAGLTFKDLADAQSGKVPDGVDASKLQAVVKKLSSLNDSKFKKANDDITKHAKKECKVDLDG